MLAAPPGYEFPPDFQAAFRSRFPDVPLIVESDPKIAVDRADVVYTDVWASMGQEHEAETRRSVFAPYQVNKELLAGACSDAIFLHCLPAHRGEEVTSDVLDGPRSQIIPQAANRLHFQMALWCGSWAMRRKVTRESSAGRRRLGNEVGKCSRPRKAWGRIVSRPFPYAKVGACK